MKNNKNNQKSKTIIKNNNNNNINSKLNQIQSPRDLISFKKIIQRENSCFIVFKSIYDLVLIVFIDIKQSSIIAYNLIDDKKIFEIKNVNAINTNELKHYLDKKNKRDLVASIKMQENNIKVWNFNNLECILNINYFKKISPPAAVGNMHIINYITELLNLNSICFINNDNNIHIIASSINIPQTQLIHIYNLRGEKIKEINNNKVQNYFVDTFYDDKFSKNYIIISTNADIRAIDYNNTKIMKHFTPVNEEPIKVTTIKNIEINRKLHFDDNHVFRDVKYSEGPLYILVKKCGNITKLFVAMKENTIKIWNFHSEQLLCEINISKSRIKGFCLWDEENLLVGTGSGLKLIDLNKNKLAKNFMDIVDIGRIDIVNIPKKGKCLITSNYQEMNLWLNKNLIKK